MTPLYLLQRPGQDTSCGSNEPIYHCKRNGLATNVFPTMESRTRELPGVGHLRYKYPTMGTASVRHFAVWDLYK